MARYIFQGTFRDGQGNVVSGGTVSVCDADTTTASTLYEASTGGTSVSSVTSDSNGFFYFYVDSSDYAAGSKFDITLSKSGYSDKTFEDIVVFCQGPKGDTGPAGPVGAKIESVAWSTNDMVFTLDDDSTVTLSNAKIDLMGLSGADGSVSQTFNLSPRVGASANVLNIFTKAGGAVPDDTNYFSIAIPDGTGYTNRIRNAAYLSGTSTITMANATNYWSKGSSNGIYHTAYLYAIWDGTGIVWALCGIPGLQAVNTSTTVTDYNYFLLEDSSTYSRSASHFCVCVGLIMYEYDTGDTPDYTIQSTGDYAPKVLYNPFLTNIASSANLKTFMNAAGTAPEWAQGIKVITSTRDMTAESGDVSYSGVGFKPSLIVLEGAVQAAQVAGWGVADGTSKHHVSYDNANGYYRAGTSWAFAIIGGTAYQGAIWKSFDADGFTLTWTKGGGPTGTITFSATCYR